MENYIQLDTNVLKKSLTHFTCFQAIQGVFVTAIQLIFVIICQDIMIVEWKCVF